MWILFSVIVANLCILEQIKSHAFFQFFVSVYAGINIIPLDALTPYDVIFCS